MCRPTDTPPYDDICLHDGTEDASDCPKAPQISPPRVDLKPNCHHRRGTWCTCVKFTPKPVHVHLTPNNEYR